MSNQYNDSQLLACLEKMAGRKALPEGELHLCWLVEETLNKNSYNEYEIDLDELITIQTGQFIGRLTSATWQQRTIALCKVKGIEIVEHETTT